jgi:hypothetical protein
MFMPKRFFQGFSCAYAPSVLLQSWFHSMAQSQILILDIIYIWPIKQNHEFFGGLHVALKEILYMASFILILGN